jgi:hypothetical protein
MPSTARRSAASSGVQALGHPRAFIEQLSGVPKRGETQLDPSSTGFFQEADSSTKQRRRVLVAKEFEVRPFWDTKPKARSKARDDRGIGRAGERIVWVEECGHVEYRQRVLRR